MAGHGSTAVVSDELLVAATAAAPAVALLAARAAERGISEAKLAAASTCT
jgi:hypothetical protein